MAHYVGILDGEGAVWGVRVPDLPGVHGGGDTPEAAIADAISAAREWAAHVIAKGKEVPSPHALSEVFSEAGEGEAIVMLPLPLDTAGW